MNASDRAKIVLQAAQTVLAEAEVPDLSVPLDFIENLQAAQSQADVIDCFAAWADRLVVADHLSLILPESEAQCALLQLENGTPGLRNVLYNFDQSASGLVITEKAPVWLDQFDSLPFADCIDLQRKGLNAWMLVPISRDAQCFGAIGAAFAKVPKDPGPMLAALVVVGRCLANQLALNEQIKDLVRASTTDPLTAVGNRRRFNDRAGLLWDAWGQEKAKFAIISLDIDHFKTVNDQFGHDVGDDVIRIVAERLVNVVRASDEVVRMGGEEFCVVLPGGSLHTAGTLAERCRLALCEQPFAAGEHMLDITASFSAAEVSDSDYSLANFSQRLDRALYAAKAKGRNQVEISVPEPEDSVFFLTG